MTRPDTASVCGVPLALTTYANSVDWIAKACREREKAYVCVAAVHTVMLCSEDTEFAEAVRDSTFTVPDGRPLVWALRLLGHKLPDRVYGPTLMLEASRYCAQHSLKIFLYGGRDQMSVERLRSRLTTQFPGLQVVGTHAPPFRPLTADEEDRVVGEINESGADIVWVGIGVPKQEKWMAAMRSRLAAPVLIGVGAAFDFHAGLVRQAPSWMQKAGLEWFFRILQEPRRLFKRYLIYNTKFLLSFGLQYIRHLRNRAKRPVQVH